MTKYVSEKYVMLWKRVVQYCNITYDLYVAQYSSSSLINTQHTTLKKNHLMSAMLVANLYEL